VEHTLGSIFEGNIQFDPEEVSPKSALPSTPVRHVVS